MPDKKESKEKPTKEEVEERMGKVAEFLKKKAKEEKEARQHPENFWEMVLYKAKKVPWPVYAIGVPLVSFLFGYLARGGKEEPTHPKEEQQAQTVPKQEHESLQQRVNELTGQLNSQRSEIESLRESKNQAEERAEHQEAELERYNSEIPGLRTKADELTLFSRIMDSFTTEDHFYFGSRLLELGNGMEGEERARTYEKALEHSEIGVNERGRLADHYLHAALLLRLGDEKANEEKEQLHQRAIPHLEEVEKAIISKNTQNQGFGLLGLSLTELVPLVESAMNSKNPPSTLADYLFFGVSLASMGETAAIIRPGGAERAPRFYEKAAPHLESLVNENRSIYDSQLLGIVLTKQGNAKEGDEQIRLYKKAVQVLEKSQKENKNDTTKVLLQNARARLERARNQDEAEYNNTIDASLVPGGILAFREGRYRDAESSFRSAVARKGQPKERLWLGITLSYLGEANPEERERLYEESKGYILPLITEFADGTTPKGLDSDLDMLRLAAQRYEMMTGRKISLRAGVEERGYSDSGFSFDDFENDREDEPDLSEGISGGYVLLTVGNGGPKHAWSAGKELGLILPINNREWVIGGGFSSVYIGGGFFDYIAGPIPENNSYLEEEFYLAGGFKPNNRASFVVLTAGYSGVTLDPEQPINIENFTCSAQLRYINKHLIAALGIHNRRGLVGGVGINF